MNKIIISILIFVVLASSVSALLGDNLSNAWLFNNTGELIDYVDSKWDSTVNDVTSKTVRGLNKGDNSAWQFVLESTDSVSIPADVWRGKAEFSMVVWLNLSNDGGSRNIWSSPNANNAIIINAAGEYQYVMTGGAGEILIDSNVVVSDKNWVMLSMVYNGTHLTAYVNQTNVGSSAMSGNTAGDSGVSAFGSNAQDSGAYLSALIDEAYMWNRSLNASEILELWNNGDGTFYPFTISEEAVIATSTPIIVFPSPIDNSNNNTNVTLNVTHDTVNNDVNYYLYFGTSSPLTETDLFQNNVTRTGDEYASFLTNVSDGTYFWKWRVQNTTNGIFSGNTTARTLIIDTVNPTITINPNNAFNSSNLSSHNQYFDFMFLNISFFDEGGLFGVVINITTGGVTFFNYTNTSLGTTTTHNFTRNLSTALWPDGVFDIELIASDIHTASKIEDYEVSRFLSRITFNTIEGNKVDIIGSGAISTDYTKKKDRYEFDFNYFTSKTERTFTVRCDNELYYIDESEYEGHFVCWNEGKKEGNWIDFEGLGDNYTVKKINDKEYDIIFKELPYSDKVSVKSIGGLNKVTQNFQWFKGSTTNTFEAVASSGTEQDFSMNITLDFDLVKNITATFTYNTTDRTITRAEGAASILFNTTFTIPDVNQTLNFSWIFNVTQRNDANYLFSVNASQQLVSPQVNLTILDEENQTLITEDLTIFFTGPTSVQTNTSSGNLLIGNLLVGEYFIQAEGATYPRRGVFFTASNASAKLNLYLVKDITGNDFIDYIVQDDGRNRLENVRLTYQKNINNSFVTVAQIETDFAGQARVFQDQQNEYRIVMSLAGFATQTIDLIPLLTSYTITLSTLPTQLFDTTYEGIRYIISPKSRILNITNKFRDMSFNIFDGSSSLEFFGLQIIDHNFTCIPANCITNISGSPAGGTAVVQINLSSVGNFDTIYFFKRNGFPIQFVNGQEYSAQFLIGDRLADNLGVISDNLGTPIMRSIFAAILITVLCVLASQMGVIGMGLVVVVSLGTMFFMLTGFINPMLAMITIFSGITLFVVLGRD